MKVLFSRTMISLHITGSATAPEKPVQNDLCYSGGKFHE